MSNSNKPAFPRPHSVDTGGDHNEHIFAQEGLTKREYFAVMAMQGCLAGLHHITSYNEVYVAEHAIKIADELLKQLDE